MSAYLLAALFRGTYITAHDLSDLLSCLPELLSAQAYSDG